MYVDGYTRRKRDPYKPIDYLGVFSIGEFVGYLIRSLVAPAFVWFPDILIGMPDNLIQAIAAYQCPCKQNQNPHRYCRHVRFRCGFFLFLCKLCVKIIDFSLFSN